MQRGRKPKPFGLRVIDGNAGRRPLPPEGPKLDGKPVVPKWLKGRGAEIWCDVLAFATWLTVADSYKLASWCDRQAEFERSRRKWSAADRREHRAAGSELGLDPSSRTRMPNRSPADAENPFSRFKDPTRFPE
jgi:phage terminase small subunit